MENQDPYDSLSRFALSVFAVNSLLLQSGDIVTRPIGQSSARWQVLGVAGYLPQTVAQMAREIGNSRQAVQRLADTLAKEGLVKFVNNPADKRAQLVELTQEGEKVLAEIDRRDKEWSQMLMSSLSPGQLVELSDALDKIATIFATHLNKEKL